MANEGNRRFSLANSDKGNERRDAIDEWPSCYWNILAGCKYDGDIQKQNAREDWRIILVAVM